MPGSKCPECGKNTLYGLTCRNCGYKVSMGPGKGKECPMCGRYTLKKNFLGKWICNNCGATMK